MNATKYASLPDIDTAPDVYETEDVFPTYEAKQESSDDEPGPNSRQNQRGKDAHARPEELDASSLMDPGEAGRKFRKAEKRRHRPRIQYTYPPSPTSSGRSSPELEMAPHHNKRSLTVAERLANLKAELASLEFELIDTQKSETPSVIEDDDEGVLVESEKSRKAERGAGAAEAGDLVKEVVDVKARLDKLNKLKETKTGREKLVSAVIQGVGERTSSSTKPDEEKAAPEKEAKEPNAIHLEVKDVAEMDRRLGELERAVGSASTTADESTPLPPPLLPLLTRLNTQLTLLAQPRHIDNISRRLKLLLSDLDRLSAINNQHNNPNASGAQRRGASSHNLGHSTHGFPGSLPGIHPSSPVTPTQSAASSSAFPHTDQLAPILNRLSPLLPHIPHILTRLRTLSTLHTNAAGFQSTLEALEEEQIRVRRALEELEGAVKSVEGSLKENESLVKGNVVEVERRVEEVVRKVDAMSTGN